MSGKPPKTAVEERVFKKRDILGEWEVVAIYEFEWIESPDFRGYVRLDLKNEFFLNGQRLLPQAIDPDDLQDLNHMVEAGWPDPARL